MVEFMGWICPLTPVENWLRVRDAQTGYEQDFLSYYLLPLLYPAGLTRDMQYTLGLFVLAVNAVMYGWLGFRARRRSGRLAAAPIPLLEASRTPKRSVFHGKRCQDRSL